MKIIIYIVMIMFLMIPVSYAEDTSCIIQKNSVITYTFNDMLLFKLFAEWDEKELTKFMVVTKRFISTKKELKIRILDMVDDEDGIPLINFCLIEDDKIEGWVLYYNIECNGDEDDKTKRRTPKRQEEEREDIKERTKGPAIKA